MVIDVERSGNLIEAGFWVIFGLVLAVSVRRQSSPMRRLGIVACVACVAFGLSDLVEARTGAWWRPWWLLVWKGFCLIAMTACFIAYRRLRASSTALIEDHSEAASSSM